MATYPSAKNQDPTLYCKYFGGPRDGLKTGDLPAHLSGEKLTGMVSKTPLSQPHQFSLYAVYECTSETQIDGFWEFHYRGMEGPNGEHLVAEGDESDEEPEYEADDVEYRFADRFALQQAWWIASEVARRHPHLEITRLEDPQHYQLLVVHDGPTGARLQFDLPAGASWMDGTGEVQRLSWLEAFTKDNPHAVVKRLEKAAGFGTPVKAAKTTERTIVYRLIARILATHLDDRHTWQAVTAEIPDVATDEPHEAARVALEPFSTARTAAERYTEDIRAVLRAPGLDEIHWHQPMWFLLRDLEPVLVLDEGGFAHLRDGVQLDLLALYRALGRDLGALASIILMEPSTALGMALLFDRRDAKGAGTHLKAAHG